MAETLHLLEEALRSDCEVKMVLAAESAREAVEALAGVKTVVLPDALLQKHLGHGNQPGRDRAGAAAGMEVWNSLFRGVPLVVVLDGLQDPGNAGAIVRAAEAFGATGAIFLKGTVSPYNPKTLRASAGSLFRVPSAPRPGCGGGPRGARAKTRWNCMPACPRAPRRTGAVADAAPISP